MDAVRSAGAHVVVNHRGADYVQELKAVGGFDLCLEMASHVNLATDFSLMNTHGRVVVIGSRGSTNKLDRLAELQLSLSFLKNGFISPDPRIVHDV